MTFSQVVFFTYTVHSQWDSVKIFSFNYFLFLSSQCSLTSRLLIYISIIEQLVLYCRQFSINVLNSNWKKKKTNRKMHCFMSRTCLCIERKRILYVLLAFHICLFLWLDECLVCPLGYFCGELGLVQPSGPCAPGFLCFLRSTVPNPTDNNTGALCPPGSYCQLGVRSGTGQNVQNILHNNENIVLKSTF